MKQQIRMRFPEGRAKAFTLSYDDGVEQDIRLIELIRAHGVKCTFNLSSGEYPPEGFEWEPGRIHRRMPLSRCREVYQGDDIEVAIHGTHHPFWDALPTPSAMWDIINDRRELESQYGRIIRGGAFPFGTYSDSAVEMLRLAGIAYCRTVKSSRSFNMPADWLRLEATCHHRDPELYELADRFVSVKNVRDPLMFYVWGHTYEFEDNDNWHVMEELLDRVSGHDDVWYATNIEICDYAHAFGELIYSADGSMAYNPTVTDLWAWNGEETIKIPSGGTAAV